MSNTATNKSIKLRVALCAAAVSGLIAFGVSCNKSSDSAAKTAAVHRTTDASTSPAAARPASHQSLTSVVTVAMLRTSSDGQLVRAMFNENEQVLNVTDAGAIAALKEALANNKPVQITFDPWAGLLLKAGAAPAQEAAALNARTINTEKGTAKKIDLTHMTDDVVNGIPSGIAVMNTTEATLTNVIPDMQTAQRMFDYITHQCCQLAGPYAVDHCITFQYCPDGCYARAHKMCWIINNTYKYGTQKVFSFANAGSDELCVKAEKWGGCCINWWYHVAPLVTIKTPSGPKAYVFDPAMFDQPVLLATWLHAQENPACTPSGDIPHVTMINIQPTASYTPSGSTGYLFSTDPYYTSTNSTLVSYQHLISCP